VELTIRPYADADLEACRSLWRELTQHHRDLYDDQGIGGDDPGTHFDGYLANSKLESAWVAETDGRVVGLTGLLRDGDEGEVEPVIVAATVRGQGIGRRLLDHVVDVARERGLRSISIRPVARNALALHAFRQAGFRLLGHVELFLPLGSAPRDWKQGIELHGEPFGF
jgi:GNAT superfamily N-acetyltransferase